MDLVEIKELIDTTPEELIEDSLMERSVSTPSMRQQGSPPPDNEEENAEAVPGNKLTLDSLAEVLLLFKTDFFNVCLL